MSRTVTLVLVDAGGAALGALPPFDVPSPWWQEVADVVLEARRRYGVDAAVLRILHAERPAPHGGAVTYLAQVDRPTTARLTALEVDLAPHPLRAPWAEPGGPDRSLRWAAGELRRLGRGTFTPHQQRAWNLSAIWRLDPPGDGDGAAGPGAAVWLKQVPPFFAHEGAVLRWLGRVAPRSAPVLLADDGAGRVLLDHIPGEDCYGLPADGRHAIAADYHEIQLRAVPHADELVRRGVPDRRGARLARAVRDALAAHGADLSRVRRLVDGLDERLAAIADCGLPETLVHGDLHPGNVRADGDRRVIVDWGDSSVGNPAFDILSLIGGLDPDQADGLVRAWERRWRESVPGCRPGRAVELLRPIAPLVGAATYAAFVARIEPSERPFHASDVPACLRLAAELG